MADSVGSALSWKLLSCTHSLKNHFQEPKMADHHHFEKQLLNRHNSALVQPIAMKFGTMTHFDHLKLSNGQKFTKTKMADGR